MLTFVKDNDPNKDEILKFVEASKKIMDPIRAASGLMNAKMCKVCKSLSDMFPLIMTHDRGVRDLRNMLLRRAGKSRPQPIHRKRELVYCSQVNPEEHHPLDGMIGYAHGRCNIYDTEKKRFVLPVWCDQIDTIRTQDSVDGSQLLYYLMTIQPDTFPDISNDERLMELYGTGGQSICMIADGNGTFILPVWLKIPYRNDGFANLRMRMLNGTRISNIINLSSKTEQCMMISEWLVEKENTLYRTDSPHNIEGTL